MRLEQDKQDLIDKTLIFFGSALLCFGLGLLIFTGLYAYEVLKNPEQVELVHTIIYNMNLSDKAAYGTFKGDTFEFHLSPTFTLSFLLLILVMLLNTIIGVAGTILSAGLKLLQAGLQRDKPVQSSTQVKNLLS